ncbi:hypothetical protein AM1_6185 [Acaryochloris marina MBIC11017]|uniref:Uncharacterized protein n=1 Tax=Acaryochloris marina (strain MBIC 11017) TaxID=329726 RepID=B0C4X9_ACAM1|nr:hypothetical protein AM1_6185 [Acaryochloris marina MBIC11017]
MSERGADVIGLTLDKVDVDIPDQPTAEKDIELAVVLTSRSGMEFVGRQSNAVDN